ncbi:hypothetical protein [Streptomyces sp. CB01881]|uniref:hypothetical protein n=1 Tax=Streptomyces sp. CB01881 TaxID=2078691 RepID=UPI000CDC0F3C|nr:hypothetical protein [Streptomyces sp. CB01881]AUY53130.1 hypothetical protein C2142_34165 [Streptomyces sp. CB01881]TYC69283.1 hypothetical protein EH183_34230 [Streptomyces sp. CB01881]
MAAQTIAGGTGSGAVVTRHLVVGDVSHQYSVTPDPVAPLLVAELTTEPGGATRAMEFLRRPETASSTVSVIGAAGQAGTVTLGRVPVELWASFGVTPEFEAQLRGALEAAGSQELSGVDLSALAPLMLLRTHRGAERPFTEVLMCGRVRSLGTLFVRVARFAHAAESGIAELVSGALELSASLQDNVRIEGNAYTSYEKGIEIEQKVNVYDEVSIWSLTQSLWSAVENGEFNGFITDPGYELTRWHFIQHNFEVTAPASEVGHIAFQETPSGTYQLKLKRFAEDALRREEIVYKGIDIPGADFSGYLRREYPDIEFRRLPSLTRTRFDINVQSVITGNYFGIETDEVLVLDPRGPKLRQVEMEYLETRWHEGMDPSTIDDDMNRLTELVEEHLAKRGIAAERTFYSKLSFLKDCVRRSDQDVLGV